MLPRDFDKLLADAPHLAANLRNYIAGFSANMREALEIRAASRLRCIPSFERGVIGSGAGRPRS